MPKFSKQSLDKLNTCHDDLQILFKTAIKHYDCTIICGVRSDEEQKKAFDSGKSKLTAGQSKHNYNPSLAVDAYPYPLPKDWGRSDFKELAKFYHFAGYIKGVADNLNIKIRYGGDWNGNNNFRDQSFDDLIHYELII